MSIRRFAIVALAIALLLSGGAHAQTTPAPTVAPTPAPSITDNPSEQRPLGADNRDTREPSQTAPSLGVGSWGLRTAMALGVVVMLIFGLRIVIRRMTGVAGAGAAGGMVDVLARTSIGPRTQVLFLKINDRVIVAGQTPAGINTLAQIDQPEEVAAVLAQVNRQKNNSVSQGFSRLLSSFDRGGEPDDLAQAQPDDGDAVDRARSQVAGALDRLRRLRKGRDPQ